MSTSRKLFVPIEISATIGNHSLLIDNKVPVIGYITDKKRYTKEGGCIVPREVCFHYGTEHQDFFYFINGSLEFQSVTIATPEYITNVYSECAMMKEIGPQEFIEKVLETYVLTEMGL